MRLLLKRLQCVVNNWTITGPIDELPHPRADRSLTPNQVRKVPASVRPRFVDQAIVTREKYASGFGPAQVSRPILRVLNRILFQERDPLDFEKGGQPLHIPVVQFYRSHTATIRALRTIDLLLDRFRRPAQPPLVVVVCFQVLAEAFVFGAALFPEPLDLDEISDERFDIYSSSTDA